jgi:hypothetical protein
MQITLEKTVMLRLSRKEEKTQYWK